MRVVVPMTWAMVAVPVRAAIFSQVSVAPIQGTFGNNVSWVVVVGDLFRVKDGRLKLVDEEGHGGCCRKLCEFRRAENAVFERTTRP